MNWKFIVLWPVAAAVHLGEVVLLNGKSTGFPDWVADRKIGDPKGCPLQTREQARNDEYVKSKQAPR